MANAYLVAPRSGIFGQLPDDLQRVVRKHTAAHFAVDWLDHVYLGEHCLPVRVSSCIYLL